MHISNPIKSVFAQAYAFATSSVKTTAHRSTDKSVSRSLKYDKFEENFFYSNKTYIHPSSIIGSNVIIEKNVKIGPFCSIIGNVKIGPGTKIYPGVSIGFPAQDVGTTTSLGFIEIGKNCQIREYVTIGASKSETGKTSIGNNCYIMSYSHIAHDVTLQDNVILINNVNLGGHVYVEKNAFLMANCAAHQFCRIGQYTALTPFSAIRQDLPPFCIFSEQPGKFYGLHLVGLKRAGFSQESLAALKHVTRLFYHDKLLLSQIKMLAAQENSTWGQNKHVQEFLKFIENSKRGVSKKSALK